MTALLDRIVTLLPLDPGGRRAVEETLEDWRYELGQATTPAATTPAGIRGALAVAGALCRIAVFDTRHAAPYRTAATATLLALLLSGLTVAAGWQGPAGIPVMDAMQLCLLLSIANVPIAMAQFLAILPVKSERESFFGVAIVASAFCLISLGWVVPDANQEFRERTRHHHALSHGQDVRGPLSRGVNERRLGVLIADAAAGDRAARHGLLVRASIVLSVPVFCLLGVHARAFARAQRLIAWAPALAIACLGLSWAVATLVSPAIRPITGPAGLLLSALGVSLVLALTLGFVSGSVRARQGTTAATSR